MCQKRRRMVEKWTSSNIFVCTGGHQLTYLLTYSMVQSPSWEANWFAASQTPHISRNPKVQYRTHKRPPPVSILGQPNPVHIHTSHLLEIRSNIIHPSTPRSSQWSPSLRFETSNTVIKFTPLYVVYSRDSAHILSMIRLISFPCWTGIFIWDKFQAQYKTGNTYPSGILCVKVPVHQLFSVQNTCRVYELS